MFDDVMLLAEGGQVAYFGPMENLISFFERQGVPCPLNYNPADVFVHAIALVPTDEEDSRRAINKLCSAYRNEFESSVLRENDFIDNYGNEMGYQAASLHQTQNVVELNTPSGKLSSQIALFFTELRWLMYRSLKDSLRKPQIHMNRTWQILFNAVVIAFLYSGSNIQQADQSTIQNLNGLLFILITETSFCFIYGSMNEFPNDLPLARRETSDGLYRPISFFLSKIFAFWPIYLAQTAVSVAIMFSSSDLGKGASGYFFGVAVAFMNAISASAYGTMLGLVFKNPVNSNTTTGVINSVLILSAGFYINLDSITKYLSWIRWISWFYYSFVLLITFFWDGVEYIACSLGDRSTCVDNGKEVIMQLAVDPSSVSYIQYFLLCFCVQLVYHGISFSLLLWRLKHYG